MTTFGASTWTFTCVKVVYSFFFFLKKTLVSLFLNTFFLKYFTIIIGAISKTTYVLKLSQDPSAKIIKYQIKIKIKIFSI